MNARDQKRKSAGKPVPKRFELVLEDGVLVGRRARPAVTRPKSRFMARQTFKLDLLEAQGSLPTCHTAGLALAGNGNSGLRNRARDESWRRAMAYFQRMKQLGTPVALPIPTRGQIRGVALQLARKQRDRALGQLAAAGALTAEESGEVAP